MDMSPASPADWLGSTESAVISTVEINATIQPIHTFLPGHSPANIASSGVRMHVACRGHQSMSAKGTVLKDRMDLRQRLKHVVCQL